MKKSALLLSAAFISGNLSAQTAGEWFSQKKTQLEYLVNQIAAYRVFAGYLEKGFQLTGQGLSAIYALKHGEFENHLFYFSSFTKVNPSLYACSGFGDIISLQAAILFQLDQTMRTPGLRKTEYDLIAAVSSDLTMAARAGSEELQTLLSDNTISMQDADRLRRIEAIRDDMIEKYVFARSYRDQWQGLIKQRSGAEQEINVSTINLGIP